MEPMWFLYMSLVLKNHMSTTCLDALSGIKTCWHQDFKHMEMQNSTSTSHDGGFFVPCKNKQDMLDNNEMSSFYVNFYRTLRNSIKCCFMKWALEDFVKKWFEEGETNLRDNETTLTNIPDILIFVTNGGWGLCFVRWTLTSYQDRWCCIGEV